MHQEQRAVDNCKTVPDAPTTQQKQSAPADGRGELNLPY